MTKTTPKSSSFLLPIAVILAGLIIAGAVIYSSNENEAVAEDQNENTGSNDSSPEGYSVNEDGWPTLGDPEAPVTIVEYSDYACPFCQKFALETLPLIKENYIETGIVKFIYKDFAVVGGERVAEAAHCAGEQGKYWEYHDWIYGDGFQDRSRWSSSETHFGYAKALNLDADALVECFESRRYRDKVAESTREATNNGGQGTPYFIINGISVSGAQPFGVFEQIIKTVKEQ